MRPPTSGHPGNRIPCSSHEAQSYAKNKLRSNRSAVLGNSTLSVEDVENAVFDL
ncbi:hypothetical protein P7K49_009180 [Saguinus oedipus]|uniref:FLJ21616 n=1 Tax=Saguinus oedipus TaxID=9490 RepID=A0ABQ9VKM1_SAGOE|nr:hypothetical protein P7K49_009180 [Saguinus oedipus]